MTYERVADVIDVWSLTLAGEPQETLLGVSSTRSELHPRLSPDGTRLAVVSNRTGFFEVWTPEGRYLYYSKREEAGVWRRPLEGGEETRLVDSSHPFDWATWEVGRDGIYFVVRWPTFICLYRFADGEVVQLFKPDREVSFATPAMTLDGEHGIIFAKVTQSEDETMMLDLGD